MRTRSRGRRSEKEQKMAAAVAAAVSEGGAKMAEAGALAGGGMAAANGAGNGVGEGVPKSEGERPTQNEKRKEKSAKRGGGSRFEPYASPSKRYRAFITNIPFDVKWQYLKDLVKEKVGEVTYVELLMDAEGKSRVSLRENFFRGFLLHDQKNNDKKINNVTVNGWNQMNLGCVVCMVLSSALPQSCLVWGGRRWTWGMLDAAATLCCPPLVFGCMTYAWVLVYFLYWYMNVQILSLNVSRGSRC
ncbi:nuclear ribonucleoprotein M isoform X1 [Podarcis lilfordi]|uniref:Nuclear ribonucleoprotein M isoform X1 n=1 Tax=Podarcis lilfordi TaxID=74358 RepID=A0AA35LN09_9SAUR|nr:nuclear ribonucleoprotein M isoform X1 [Podarcis lilfordi]